MKVHSITVKQDFAVIVAFYYNICLFKNPVITILKVVGSEDCVRENKFPLWGLGAKPPAAGLFFNLFRKKQSFLRYLDYILNVFDILNMMTCMVAWG